jgi:hypothetical protein
MIHTCCSTSIHQSINKRKEINVIIIRNPAATNLIPEFEPYLSIRNLVQLRFTQLCEGSDDPYDADELGYMIVVQSGDSVTDLESLSGCPVMHNYFDPHIKFRNPEFVPSAEAIEDHGYCIELTYILGGDFGMGIFVPKEVEGIDADLLAMCAEYAQPALTEL